MAFVEDGGFYPRATGDDPVLGYWRAIAVMATTLRAVGADWPVTVSTNRPPTEPTVRSALDRLGVGYRATPFDHRPPPGYFDRFSGSFYLLDALADAVERTPSGTRLLLVDPDCVWVRPPTPLLGLVDADPDALVAYEITYAPGQAALGLTLAEMATFFSELGERPIVGEAPYAGGELLLGERDRLAQLLPLVEQIWDESLRRFERGERIRVNTEEHVLSFALGQLGWTGGTANPFVRRIWTKSPPDRNIQGDERSLVLWHALTEKGRGLDRLFEDAVQGHPALARADERYRDHLARRLHVDLDLVGRAKAAVTSRLYTRPHPTEW